MQVRLTPDIPRGYPMDMVELTARHAVAYHDRGVVGLGLGGFEAQFPPEPYAEVFALARDGGVPAVPHAGEAAGPESVRGALTALHAVRIRHGIRAIEDPELVRELAERGTVLDVCPVSNLRTGTVASLAEHPLPALVAAGVACSVSTDDPAMFGTDLDLEYQVVQQLGVSPEDCYRGGRPGRAVRRDHPRDAQDHWPRTCVVPGSARAGRVIVTASAPTPRAGAGRSPAVAIVGGGVAGLAAAFLLRDAGLTVTVLEGSPRLGGKLAVSEVGGVEVDAGAEALLARRPEGVALIAELGLSGELRQPGTTSAGIWTRGEVRPLPRRQFMGVPADFDELAATGLLSAAGLARAREDADGPPTRPTPGTSR